MQKNIWDPNIPSYTKIHSKGVTVVKAETMEHLEKNIEGNLHDLGLGDEFSYMTPKAQ